MFVKITFIKKYSIEKYCISYTNMYAQKKAHNYWCAVFVGMLGSTDESKIKEGWLHLYKSTAHTRVIHKSTGINRSVMK